MEIVGCLHGCLVPPLADVAELNFPRFLDKRGWMTESCCAWVDLPHEAMVPPRVAVVVPLRVAVVVSPRVAVVEPPLVAVVPPHPRVFVFGIVSFYRRPYR